MQFKSSKQTLKFIKKYLPKVYIRVSYREFPRKPRPLAARMNWKNKFKIT